jgi:hypothetical protein
MMCSLVFLVFSQHPDTVLPVDRLIAQARAHFAATVELVDQSPDGPRVTLSYDAHGSRHPFDVESRRALAADLDAARAAENVNRGAGLADLAGRCGWVWTVVAREEAPEWLSLDFCALLASIALGPILPPGGGSLLGVRSARERAQTLRGGR